MKRYGTFDVELSRNNESNDNTEFYKLLFQSIFRTPKSSLKTKIAGFVGFCIGTVGMYHIWLLGGKFGNLISESCNILDPKVNKVLYYAFAIDAFIPMMALSGLATKDHFQSAVTPKIANSSLLSQKAPVLIRVFKAFAYLFGTVAALSPAYLTFALLEEQSLWLRILLSLPAYIGGLMFKVKAELTLIRSIHNLYERHKHNPVYQIRQQLLDRLNTVKKTIKTIPDGQLKQTVDDILSIGDQPSYEEVCYCFQSLMRLSLSHLPQTNDAKSCSQLTIGTAGLIIGLASGYTYYDILQQAANQISNWFGVQNKLFGTVLFYAIPAVGVIPWGALGGEAASRVFQKLSQRSCCGVTNKTPLSGYEKVATIISAFFGASAAISITYLAVLATSAFPVLARILLISPTFLGPACVRSSAVFDLLNRSVSWVKERGNTKYSKQTVLRYVEQLSDSINILSDDRVLKLAELIAPDILSDTQSMQSEPDLRDWKERYFSCCFLWSPIDPKFARISGPSPRLPEEYTQKSHWKNWVPISLFQWAKHKYYYSMSPHEKDMREFGRIGGVTFSSRDEEICQELYYQSLS